MRKVLIISSNTATDPYPVPPIGPCMVARCLGQRHEVAVLDGLQADPAAVARSISACRPDVVGIGIRNVDDMDMVRPRSFVEGIVEGFVGPVRRSTDAPIVLGGSGFCIFPRELMDRCGAEYGVVGDGGPALLALVDAIEGGRDPAAVPGVLAADGRSTPPLPPGPIARPDIDGLVDMDPYRGRGAYPILTKRGCSRGCVYCTYPSIDGGPCRPRDPSDVADEIEGVASRIGRVTFEIVDSTFNDPPGHAEGVCAEIARRGLGLDLRTMGVNPGGATERLFEAMRGAGFGQVDCTPDSASPAVMRALAKGFGPDDLLRAARGIGSSGMPAMWFFLFGGPGETEGTIRETFDFIDREVSRDDMVHVSAGIRIYPGTRLHRLAVEEGVLRPTESLLEPPRFYVSPALGAGRLVEALVAACAARPNCVPSWETAPDAGLIARAASLRSRLGLDEPMFRTFLRLRRGEDLRR